MKDSIKNFGSILLGVLLVLILMTSGCKKSNSDSTSGPGTNEVWMQNSAFTPTTITVSVNTTVTWINKDNMNHTVTSNTSGLFSSGTIGNGSSFTHQFTTAGTFNYHCNFHSGMNGTVVVQ